MPGALPAPVTHDGHSAARPERGSGSASSTRELKRAIRSSGAVERAVTVADRRRGTRIVEDAAGDVSGHGTACAGIIRSLAPEASS